MNEFTKREVDILDFDEFDGLIVGTFSGIGYYHTATFPTVHGDGEDDVEMIANAELFVAAHTTATKLAEKGYDAVKVLEVLPELVAHAEVGSVAHVYQLLEQCRGE